MVLIFNYHCYLLLFVGTYTPVTEEGNIVVGGVLASCYASPYHNLSHITMTQFRWFPHLTDWIFGKDKDSPAYVNIFINVGKWVSPYELKLN